MFQLNTLSGLVKKRKRVGRGGSRGGTSGKGHKGQKARSGDHGVGYGFEGGQMPLTRRLPKKGFNNKRFAQKYHIINLVDLEKHFENDALVTKDALVQAGIVNSKKSEKGEAGFLVKILGNGNISKKFAVHVDAMSESAQQAIKKAGGSVHLTRES